MFRDNPAASLLSDAENLIQRAGFESLTEFQKQILAFVPEDKSLLITAPKAKGTTAGMALLILLKLLAGGKNTPKALIAVPDAKTVGKLGGLFSSFIAGNRLPLISFSLSPSRAGKEEFRFLSRNPDIIIGTPQDIIDRIKKKQILPEDPMLLGVFLETAAPTPGFGKDLSFIISQLPGKTKIIMLSKNEKSESLMKEIGPAKSCLSFIFGEKKEETPMSAKITDIEPKTAEAKPDSLENTLLELVRLIKSDKDPKSLDDYKKAIKKHVPLTLRSYIGAYLLRAMAGEKPAKPAWKEKAGGAPDKSFVTLFIGAGKNRKVFPKDLAKFIASSLSLEPEKLGAIKILESYSFVDVPSEIAESAVSRLNGTEFRGRPITVNFAQKKQNPSSQKVVE